jgi:hypothetical protein
VTNAQLFFTIGLPILVFLLTWLDSRGRDQRMEEKHDRFEQQTLQNFQRLHGEVADGKISIANLRAEIFEKFQLRTEGRT